MKALSLSFVFVAAFVFGLFALFPSFTNSAQVVENVNMKRDSPAVAFASKSASSNHVRHVRSFAKNLNKAKTSLLERYTNPQTLLHLQAQAKDVAKTDQSAAVGVQRSLADSRTEIFNLVLEQCQAEVDALISGPVDADKIQALVQCIKDLFKNLLDQCFADFPGLAEPVECFVDLGLDNNEVIGDFELSDSGIDFGDFGKGDDDDDDDDDDNEGYASDSGNKFGNKFKDFEDPAQAAAFVNGLDAAKCAQVFGDANEPDLFACLTLLDADAIQAFKDALLNLKDAFANNVACKQLADLLGLEEKDDDENYDFFDEFFFDGFGFLDDLDFEDCSQSLLEGKLGGYVAAFEKCSEFDNGALNSELQSRFGDGSPANVKGVSALLIATAAAIAAYLL